jgi:ParB family transcriptional regulator, chromosome partitioning protein
MPDNDEVPSNAKRRPPALGRGLSALFGENGGDTAALIAASGPASAVASTAMADIRALPIARIRAHPDQPRRMFNEAQLAELTESIAARGVLQPILVRPLSSGDYQLVAGERRWRAAQAAGLHEIPAIVRDLSDSDTLEIALIENVQRADLNAIEEARALQALIDNFGHKQDDLAKLIGKSRSHIANLLRLLALDPLVQTALIDGRITMGHGRALINAPNSAALLEKIIRGGLSVRATEALVRKTQGRVETKSVSGPRPSGASLDKDADILALQDHLNDLLGIKSDIRHDAVGGHGTLTLHYSTIDQLDWLCQRLSGEKI